MDICIFFLFSSLSLENNLYEAKDLFELSGLLNILAEKKDENEDEWIEEYIDIALVLANDLNDFGEC